MTAEQDAERLHAAFTNIEPPPPTPAETDEERADREETERDHARGNHTYCGLPCEAEFPTEMLRNGILWRAAPGSKAMLDELLRRARAERPLSPCYEHPACGFHWHGRDGMDIPMRDGQPMCPRCELRRLADEAQKADPVVTVHASPDLSPEAEEALGALVDVAKAQMTDETQQSGGQP